MSTPQHDWLQSQGFLRLLAGRWTLAVLGELSSGGQRYQDLHDVLDGISHKVLTETLRRSERDGLITRQLDPGRVETATLYELTATLCELTDLGRSLDRQVEHSARSAAHGRPLRKPSKSH